MGSIRFSFPRGNATGADLLKRICLYLDLGVSTGDLIALLGFHVVSIGVGHKGVDLFTLTGVLVEEGAELGLGLQLGVEVQSSSISSSLSTACCRLRLGLNLGMLPSPVNGCSLGSTQWGQRCSSTGGVFCPSCTTGCTSWGCTATGVCWRHSEQELLSESELLSEDELQSEEYAGSQTITSSSSSLLSELSEELSVQYIVC